MKKSNDIDYEKLYDQTLDALVQLTEKYSKLKRKYQGATISAGRWKSKANQLQEVA